MQHFVAYCQGAAGIAPNAPPSDTNDGWRAVKTDDTTEAANQKRHTAPYRVDITERSLAPGGGSIISQVTRVAVLPFCTAICCPYRDDPYL